MKKKASQGKKFDNDKLPMTLISAKAMRKLAKVLLLGSKKYGRRNWEAGLKFSRVADALQRHFDDWREEVGESNPDPESLDSHMHHCLCNAMFLSAYMADYARYKKFDDRQR